MATSGNNLFRTVGGAVGTAIVGAVFANQLALKVRQAFPAGSTSGGAVSALSLTPSSLDKLPPAVHTPFLPTPIPVLSMPRFWWRQASR